MVAYISLSSVAYKGSLLLVCQDLLGHYLYFSPPRPHAFFKATFVVIIVHAQIVWCRAVIFLMTACAIMTLSADIVTVGDVNFFPSERQFLIE